jgi:hypothetical protein
MSNKQTFAPSDAYAAPEIFEIGAAEELTLGQANQKYLDNCKCSWAGSAIESEPVEAC